MIKNRANILKIINFIVMLCYCFVIILSYEVHQIWGNVNAFYLKSFLCAGCLDRWGLVYGGGLFIKSLAISLILVCGAFWTMKKFYKDNKCYCPVFWFILYLGILGGIIWKVVSIYLNLKFMDFFVIWCFLALLYIFNLQRRYQQRYIFLLLVLFYPAVLAFCVSNQPLLFFSYRDLPDIGKMPGLSMSEKRNLIVVYVESFNKEYSSISYQGKEYKMDDEDAVKFAYFKEGLEQGVTIGALVSSFTKMFSSYYYPLNNAVSNFTKNNNYQNLFVQPGDINFVNTKNFLKESGFDEQNIYGAKNISDIQECFNMRHKSFGGDVSKAEIDWWNGVCDIAGFNLFKERINQFDKNRPFFAVMFTLDLHAGKNPYYDNENEIVAANIENLNDFIAWFKKQDFYNNTTLIILADHAKMGSPDKENVSLYNAFFNLPERLVKNLNTNRTFNQMDMYLTMLEIMGFDLPADQVGYSTSLFSAKNTVAEKYSFNDLIYSEKITGLYLIKKSFLVADMIKDMFFVLFSNVHLLWK